MEFDMRAVTAIQRRSGPPDSGRREHRQQLRMSVSRISSCTVIAIHGEVDAANAGDLSKYVVDRLAGCSQLLFDLSELDFFGIEGISALHKINAECADRGIPWLLVAAGRVSRVLRICDPEGVLPTADNAPAGLTALDKSRHLHLL
jgi:anti-anti-sigma factor